MNNFDGGLIYHRIGEKRTSSGPEGTAGHNHAAQRARNTYTLLTSTIHHARKGNSH